MFKDLTSSKSICQSGLTSSCSQKQWGEDNSSQISLETPYKRLFWESHMARLHLSPSCQSFSNLPGFTPSTQDIWQTQHPKKQSLGRSALNPARARQEAPHCPPRWCSGGFVNPNARPDTYSWNASCHYISPTHLACEVFLELDS